MFHRGGPDNDPIPEKAGRGRLEENAPLIHKSDLKNMDSLLIVFGQASLVGAMFTLVFALGFALNRWVETGIRFLVLVLLCNTVIQGSGFLILFDYLFGPDFLNYQYIPFNYLFGPGLYFAFFHTFDEEYQPPRLWPLAFVPGLAFLLAFPVLQLAAPEVFAAHPLGFFRAGQTSWLDITFVLGFAYNGFFYLWLFHKISGVFSPRNLRSEKLAPAFIIFVLVITVISGNAIGVYFNRSLHALMANSFIITMLIIAFYLTLGRYPQLFFRVGQAVQKSRYRKSKIEGLDLEVVGGRLRQLMTEEEVFQDESLTLAGLAEKLDISAQQLSEFLNKHLGRNFSQFINGYRVAKAARILLAEEKASILSVAYRVGFNSKSAFHSAFQARFGMSPRKFLQIDHDQRPEISPDAG